MGFLNKLQSRLEIYRLEQRYTRRKNRPTFSSEAQYVDGEYVYPTHSVSSSTTTTTVPYGMKASSSSASSSDSGASSPTSSNNVQSKRSSGLAWAGDKSFWKAPTTQARSNGSYGNGSGTGSGGQDDEGQRTWDDDASWRRSMSRRQQHEGSSLKDQDLEYRFVRKVTQRHSMAFGGEYYGSTGSSAWKTQ